VIASCITATMGSDEVAAAFASDTMLTTYAGAVATSGITGEFLLRVKDVAAEIEVVYTSLGLTPMAKLKLLQKLSLAPPVKGRVALRKAKTMGGQVHSFNPRAAAATFQAAFQRQRSANMLKETEAAPHQPGKDMRQQQPTGVLDDVQFFQMFKAPPKNSVKIMKVASGLGFFEGKKDLHQKTFSFELNSDSTCFILEFAVQGLETLKSYINAGRTKKNLKMLDQSKAKKLLDTEFKLTPQAVIEAFKVYSDEQTMLAARSYNAAKEIAERLSCDEIAKEKDQLLAKVRGEATAKTDAIMQETMRSVTGLTDMTFASLLLARGTASVAAARVVAEKAIKEIEDKYERAAGISASTDVKHRPAKKAKSGREPNAWNLLQQATPGWTAQQRRDLYNPAKDAKRANKIKATAAAAAQNLAEAHGVVVPPGPPTRLPTTAPPTDPAPTESPTTGTAPASDLNGSHRTSPAALKLKLVAAGTWDLALQYVAANSSNGKNTGDEIKDLLRKKFKFKASTLNGLHVADLVEKVVASAGIETPRASTVPDEIRRGHVAEAAAAALAAAAAASAVSQLEADAVTYALNAAVELDDAGADGDDDDAADGAAAADDAATADDAADGYAGTPAADAPSPLKRTRREGLRAPTTRTHRLERAHSCITR